MESVDSVMESIGAIMELVDSGIESVGSVMKSVAIGFVMELVDSDMESVGSAMESELSFRNDPKRAQKIPPQTREYIYWYFYSKIVHLSNTDCIVYLKSLAYSVLKLKLPLKVQKGLTDDSE